MAHSHDKTLLARIGFADPDKRGGLHDEMCAFLVSPGDHQRAIAEIVLTKQKRMGVTCSRDSAKNRNEACGRPLSGHVFDILDAKTEVVLSKGRGQYAQLVGFLDATFSVRVSAHCPEHGVHFVDGAQIAFEVKAGRVSASDLIRQVNLYRSVSMRDTLWAVFLGFKYDPTDIALLRQEQITVIVAGPRFEEWRANRPPSTDTGDEI